MAWFARRSAFAPPPGQFERQLVPVASVMIASLSPLLPMIATTPDLPPLGFMMLIGWRLLRPDLWPVWAAFPLGLFDDLFSGQPLGSAMTVWTVAFLGLAMVDTRLMWRDHKQDWAIAAIAIAAERAISLGIAHFTGGAMPYYLLVPQILVAIFLFPLVSRVCAALDRWRFAR